MATLRFLSVATEALREAPARSVFPNETARAPAAARHSMDRYDATRKRRKGVRLPRMVQSCVRKGARAAFAMAGNSRHGPPLVSSSPPTFWLWLPSNSPLAGRVRGFPTVLHEVFARSAAPVLRSAYYEVLLGCSRLALVPPQIFVAAGYARRPA